MSTSFTRGENPLRADKLNTAFSERVLRSGDTMQGMLTLWRDPIQPFDAATKQYADARFSGVANVVNIKDFGAKSDGVTNDYVALNSAINAIVSMPYGGKVLIPSGRTIIGSAVVANVPAGVSLTVEGIGSQTSELYFSNATDGLSFTLQNSGNAWGLVNLRSFTVTRGPTAPRSANTGVRITADPAVNKMCGGNTSFRDLVIQGSVPFSTNQWLNGMVLDSVSGCSLDNVAIYGVNATTTDLGDILLTITGLNNQKYVSSINIINSNIQGGSAGVHITGYAQGIFITNSAVIGQYDSVRWVTVAATLAEEISISNCTFAAHHRGFYTAYVNQSCVTGSTFICFGASAGYAGIELNNCLFCNVTGNNIIGTVTAGEVGVLLSDCGVQCANTVVGNVIGNMGGGGSTTGIALRGTTTGATVVGNTIRAGAASPISQDTPINTAAGNTFNGVPMAISTNQSMVFYQSSSGLSRWFAGNDATTESGADTGSDFQIVRAHDNGTLIDAPVRISRASGFTTLTNLLVVGAMTTNTSVNILSTTLRTGTGAATGTQPKGSVWLRTDGAVGSTMYVSQGGGTWNAVAGV